VPDFIAQPFIQQGKLESVLEEYLSNANLGAYAVYPYTRHLSHRVRVLIEFLKTKLTTKKKT
jgi:DNA-binding transcriptional LysR family regulator